MSKFSSMQLNIVSSGPLFVIAQMADKEDVEPGEIFFADMTCRRVPEVSTDGRVTWRLPLVNESSIPEVNSVIEVTGQLLDPLEVGHYRRVSKWASADDCACAEKLQSIVLADLAAKTAEERKRIEENRRLAGLLIAASESASALRYTEKRPGFYIPGTVTDIIGGYFIIDANGKQYVAPGSSYCFPWVRSTKTGPVVRLEATPKPGASLAPKVGDGVIIVTSSTNADHRHNLHMAFEVVGAEAFGKANAEQVKAAGTLAIKASQCEEKEKARQSAVVAAQRPSKKGGHSKKQRV